MRDSTRSAVVTAENLCTLGRLALDANRLAKGLTGPNRTLAYDMKGSAMSVLILAGVAKANSVRPNAMVGVEIDVPDQLKVRLHIPLAQLRPAARAIINRQLAGLRCVSAVVERLRPEQVEELNAVSHPQAF